MTKSTESFANVCASFSHQKVAAMKTKIEESFARRDTFEAANGVAVTGKASSYARERNRMTGASVATARFFLALGLEPSEVIERKVAESAMFNAKALKKVTELALYSNNAKPLNSIERVTRAFIACALVAADRGIATVTNETNRKFLCGAAFSGQIADVDLIAHLDDLRHRAMTSGADTQSSQARNVLDVLKLGRIESVTKPRDAITIDSQHMFFADMRSELLRVTAAS